MNHNEYTMAKLVNTLTMGMPSTRVAKVILGFHIGSGIVAAFFLVCGLVATIGSTSYDKASTIAACLMFMLLNLAWVWACFVAYGSIEKLRAHCHTLTTEKAVTGLLQAKEVA